MKKALFTIIAILVLATAAFGISIANTNIAHPVNAEMTVCPVCGTVVGYGGSIKFETWTYDGHPMSGWILRCPTCDYTTERDVNGNTPDPNIAKGQWKAKLFPWYPNGCTHEQSLNFSK